jgi:hypothetical protein
MRYFLFVLIAILFVSSNNNSYAEDWKQANVVQKYIDLTSKCPNGICKTKRDSLTLNRLRPKALRQCQTAWALDDAPKGARCRKAVEATPSAFTFRSAGATENRVKTKSRDSPVIRPCDGFLCTNGICREEEGKPKCFCAPGFSGEKCEKACVQYICKDGVTMVDVPSKCPPYPLAIPVSFVCASDGKEVKDPKDCVQGDKRSWWLLALALYAFLVTIGWLRRRKKHRQAMASLEELKDKLEKKGTIGAASFAEAVKGIVENLPTLYATMPPGSQSSGKEPEVIKGPTGTLRGVVDPNVTVPPEAPPAPKDEPEAVPVAPAEGELPFLKSRFDNTVLGVEQPPAEKPTETSSDDKSEDSKK